MDNLAQALAYEIKQDIAQRYFGFRTRIEGEIDQYRQELHYCCGKHPPRIEVDLQRLQFLCFKKNIFQDFLVLVKLPKAFTDTFTIAPPALHNNVLWDELFVDFKGEGFTRRRRHRNLIYKVYRSLSSIIEEYREAYINLQDDHQSICDEISSFYRNNDLSGILSFLRDLQDMNSGRSQLLQSVSVSSRNLDKELQIQLPPPVTTSLHPLEELPETGLIKTQLQQIINKAYEFSNQAQLPSLPF